MALARLYMRIGFTERDDATELRDLVLDEQDTEQHFREALNRPSDGIVTALRVLYREIGDLDPEDRSELEARIALAVVSIDRLDANLHVDRGEFSRGIFGKRTPPLGTNRAGAATAS